ncbi:hypothetical protein GUJ93_ZPchr0013g35976 [Zizania palustris]|uniref:Glycoside hydrolase family 3 N-terminal domain-containing protein n=1 Tax=Zizania palustris TaxID=103762 RepID=A0A8J5WYV7_ZIZPA|nr:hypothetical protein GUJ93_ZPchr0013g35976 [Zizania palustris]
MIYGIDAVHGHNNVYGATIFPHNVALGATRQALLSFSQDANKLSWYPNLVKRIGAATALEVRATGIQYAFRAVHRGVQRSEMGGDVPPNFTSGMPYVAGKNKVAACAKHFVGDGGTQHGVNEDNTIIDRQGLMNIHMPAFLKERLNFKGFTISDWEGIDRITTPSGANYSYSVQASVLAGIDMIMVPNHYESFISILTSHVNSGIVPMSRIDDAVTRILRVKFTMGLFEDPLPDSSLADQLGKQEHRDLAREAVRKSLVLLKNGKTSGKPLLPLSKKAPKILVAGSHADNLGGGWPGDDGGVRGEPRRGVRQERRLLVRHRGGGELPYTETKGDSADLTIPEPGPSTVQAVCGAVPCATVLISGRPVVLQPFLGAMDALVAAWLPGTEGKGVTDVLFGDYNFTGKLPRTWFKLTSNSHLHQDFVSNSSI